jgi:L-aminopeptidase/D-esterase
MHTSHPQLFPATLPRGERNQISDVPGVTVGHYTIQTETHQTGITAVLPCAENPFLHKLPAGVFVLNGFGKTLGLMQIEELGQLETPIALANTLNVGLVHEGLVDYMLGRCAADGVDDVVSINPIVCECCDATLSDIRNRAVRPEHVALAIEAATADFAEGCVGAGTGVICHELKGGIGSASRQMELDGEAYTLGALVQTNHGRLADFRLDGKPVGAVLAEKLDKHEPDKGSCIVVLATDLPLDGRQLTRLARRASVGLARLGSYIGHGSGEVFIAFSTANAIDPRDTAAVRPTVAFRESLMDTPFRAAAECTEEAIVCAMLAAEGRTSPKGRIFPALGEYIEELR